MVLTEFSDFGQSLLVAPATESEQLDAAEALDRELGPNVFNDDIPAGRWKVAPHVEASVTYDDNIFIQRRNRVEDFIFSLSPGIAIGIWDLEQRRTDGFLDRQDSVTSMDRGRGSYFAADYTAILLGFAKTDSQNALDQDARMDARWQAERWTLRGGVHFESKSETNTDIGARIRRKTVSAEVVASYHPTGRTTIEAGVSLRANDPEDFVRTTTWTVDTDASYHATSALRFGLGAAFGRVSVEGGSDDIFQRILARAAYKYSDKLDFELHGGVEFRQSDGASGDRVNPIFSFIANYEPAAGTRFSVEAFRSVETSQFRPESSYERTGVTASFHRAIRAGVHLRLDAGYQESEYTGIEDDLGRRDHYVFVRPGVLYNFADWGNVALTYEFRNNDSNRDNSTFDNNQVRLQMNIVF